MISRSFHFTVFGEYSDLIFTGAVELSEEDNDLIDRLLDENDDDGDEVMDILCDTRTDLYDKFSDLVGEYLRMSWTVDEFFGDGDYFIRREDGPEDWDDEKLKTAMSLPEQYEYILDRYEIDPDREEEFEDDMADGLGMTEVSYQF